MRKQRWDNHHILFQRKQWQRDHYGGLLRSSSGLIVPMDKMIHRELHRDRTLWDGVPLLGHSALAQVRNIYEPQQSSNYTRNIERLLSAINKSNDPAKDLAINAIEMQLPYIEDGQWLLHD